MKRVLLAVAVLAIATSQVVAKDNAGKGKRKNKDQEGNATIAVPGVAHGKKSIPPGQIKRYTRGAKIPVGGDWVVITDLSKYKLPKLKAGHAYIRIDGQIVEVIEETNQVIEAFGIVADWLN